MQLKHYNCKDNQENIIDTEEQRSPRKINVLNVKATSEQLKRILNSHNIQCRFYAKILYPMNSEQRNNIVCKFECKDCEAVYCEEFERTLAERTNKRIRVVRSADTR